MKMRYIKLTCVFLFAIQICTAFSQNNADYFPWKTGDMWEYTLYYLPDIDTLQTIVIDDSTDEEGNIYTTHFSRAINPIRPPYTLLIDTLIYKIDSYLYVYHRYFDFNNGEWINVYRLNGNAGDQWVMWDYSYIGVGPFEMARINFITDTLLFGIESKLMEVIYFISGDSTDTLGLVRYRDQLIKGIGFYSRVPAELDAQIYLHGAVINGILYGDTTNTVVSVHENPAELNPASVFTLLPNYPNPFNSSTKIPLKLSNEGIVSLTIYDVLGREVATLVDEYREAGSYELEFDASNLPSGMYIYRLQSGSYSDIKKMILSK